MEPRTFQFHDKQLNNANIVPQVVLSTAAGDRYWGFVHPDANNPIGTVLNTSQINFTPSVFTARPVIERYSRLVSLDPLTESNQPLDQDVLGSWGQGQRTVLSYEAHNDDGEMTRMVGKEYILNQATYLFVGFPGLD